ncbi:MAG: FAD-dependent oxidoreductase [Myxococcota bacterium]
MYEHLLSPTRIGNVALRSRIAMAPMGVELVEADGAVREPTIAYYEARARGGAALLITENTSAAYPRGANSAHEIAVSHDKYLPGLRALTEAVHRHGAKIAIQLAFHGKIARLDVTQGRPMIVPSEPRSHMDLSGLGEMTPRELAWMMAANTGTGGKYRAATRADLAQITEDFADACSRARRAGFDAVELHGAHGYLFSSFLSPGWNFRDDEYGGPIENRARLLCEVIRACKQRAGADFTLWARIDAHEYGEPRGITLPDAVRTARLIEAAGADAVHVSAYAPNNLGTHFLDAPLPHAENAYVELARAVKAAVKIPVIAVGRIEPETADALIRDGAADLVSFGRKLLADPELPNKLAAGRRATVRPCIYCYTCVAQAFFDKPVRCAVNPEAGKEAERSALVGTAAARKRRVLVVGGGPAGMEAARVAALRGHDVTLVEKSGRLGGTLRFAALPYEPNERLLRYYEETMRGARLTLRLGTEATPALVRELAPDVVIAAVGARRERPAIPGAERGRVFDGDDLRALLTGEEARGSADKLSLVGKLAVRAGRLTGITGDPSKLREASRAYMPVGKRVVIVGGGLVGAELAEFLCERGRDVVVLEESPTLAAEMAHPRRWRVLHELRAHGVRLHTRARVLEIGERTLRFELAPAKEGAEAKREEIAADTVILAAGLAPNPEPARALREAGVHVIEIGDATGVGYLEGAIHGGFQAGCEV